MSDEVMIEDSAGKEMFWVFFGVGVFAFLLSVGIGGCTFLCSQGEVQSVYVTNSFNTLPKPAQ